MDFGSDVLVGWCFCYCVRKERAGREKKTVAKTSIEQIFFVMKYLPKGNITKVSLIGCVKVQTIVCTYQMRLKMIRKVDNKRNYKMVGCSQSQSSNEWPQTEWKNH